MNDAPGLVRVSRGGRPAIYSGVGVIAVVAILAAMPFIAFQSVTDRLVTFFVLLVLASMWNLLAGYGGLVSVGQQAYIGIGAYTALAFSDAGVQPYLAIVFAILGAALFAIPTSWLAFRLRGDYFAVATWVIAEVYRLIVIRVDELGGPSGRPLTGLGDLDPALRGAYTYWAALTLAVITVVGCYLLLRGRIGLALTAVRDDEFASSASGVRVGFAKRVIYLIAAAGCGGAGGVLLISSLSVQPNAIFSVQWSAYMIFIVIIGGIGYLEGPILGAIVFVLLQDTLSDFGAWYLVLLGAISIAGAIWLPRGLWGLLSRLGLTVFPTGYRLDLPAPAAPRAPRR